MKWTWGIASPDKYATSNSLFLKKTQTSRDIFNVNSQRYFESMIITAYIASLPSCVLLNVNNYFLFLYTV